MLLLLFAFPFSQLDSRAQTELSGGVRGVVTTEASGAAVTGARIVIKNKALRLQRETTTDAEGRNSFNGLPPGADYAITVSADDFRALVREDLTLVTGIAVEMPFALELSGLTETISARAFWELRRRRSRSSRTRRRATTTPSTSDY